MGGVYCGELAGCPTPIAGMGRHVSGGGRNGSMLGGSSERA